MTSARSALVNRIGHFRRPPGCLPAASYAIDWANPLARMLVSFAVDGMDIVRGIRGVNTSGSYGADPHAPYWEKATDALLNFPPPVLDFPAAGYPNMTMVAGGHFQSADSATALGITEASGAYGVALRPYQWAAGGNIGVTHFNYADTNGGIALPDSGYHIFGAAFDSVDHTFAIDGLQLSEGVAAAQVEVGAGLDRMTWGANEKQGSITDHLANGDRIHFTAVWNRKLLPLELLSFTRDPFQILLARNSLLNLVSTQVSATLLSQISNQGGF